MKKDGDFLYLGRKNDIIIRFPDSAGQTGEKGFRNMTYKEEFITFMVRSGVLTFGDFTT